jgi:long-chain acyl-CoA synthetase
MQEFAICTGVQQMDDAVAALGRLQAQSLFDLFEASTARFPHRRLFLTKVNQRWQEVSYGALGARVERLRRSLSGLGVETGDRIGIIADNCVEWAVIAYAAYGLGAAVVPMYTRQLARDWEHIIVDSGLVVLFVANESIRAQLGPLLSARRALRQIVVIQSPGYEEFLRCGDALAAVLRPPSAEQTAAIMYTSGTTGQPKGVVLTHGNLLSNVLPLTSMILENYQPEQHLSLSFLPWAHAFGQTVELHIAIAAGSSIAIAESLDKIADNLREVRPTALVAVPRVFTAIYAGVRRTLQGKPRWIRGLFRAGVASAGRRARGAHVGFTDRLALALADRLIFSRVRAQLGGRLVFAVSGAAALPSEVAEFISALGIDLCEGYGLTEASPIVTANMPGQNKLGTVGRPLAGVRVEIDRSVGLGSPSGEIVVHGPNVMRGYHGPNHPEGIFTKQGGLRTGDAGYLDDDGFLVLTGRIKERYKLSNGKYVVPGPLESALKLSPFVSDAMVYGDGRPHNVALLVPERAALLDWARNNGLAGLPVEQLCGEPSVIELLRGEIERALVGTRGYERIADFWLLGEDFSQENDTLTPSLKLKRHRIVARYQAEIEAMYERTATPEAWSCRAE